MAPQTFWWCFLEESGHAEDHWRRALRPMLAWLLVCLQGVSGGLGEIHREALRWIIGETTGPPRRWRKSGKPQKREHISQRKIGNKNQHFSGGIWIMLVIRGANNMNPQCSVMFSDSRWSFSSVSPRICWLPESWCLEKMHSQSDSRIVGRGTANLAQMRRIMKLHENGDSYLKWNKWIVLQ